MDPGPDERHASLSLVDRLLAAIAGQLHDQPVQSLVAAKLMVESAQPADEAAAALRARGIDALGRAAQQSRDVMWALDRQVGLPESVGAWQELLAEHLRRVAGPDGLTVAVSAADGSLDPASASRPRLQRAQSAVIDVCAAAMLAGGHVTDVTISDTPAGSHDESSPALLEMTILGAGDPDRGAGGPLLLLAAQRADTFSVDVDQDDGAAGFAVRMTLG